MMKLRLLLLTLLVYCTVFVSATTYVSAQSGDWSDNLTWAGGTAPGTTVAAGDSVLMTHTISYTKKPELVIQGYVSISGGLGTPDTFYLYGGGKLTIDSTGTLYAYRAAIINPIFINGSPNSGRIRNNGGLFKVYKGYVELAQTWSNTDGRNVFVEGTFKSGANYSSNGNDSLIGVCIEIGLQGSGNFDFSTGNIYFDGASIKGGGTFGNFTISSGTIGGNLNAIEFGSTGGNVTISNSVTDTATLMFYCVGSGGSFIDNNNHLRQESFDCTNAQSVFPCSTTVPLLPTDWLRFLANRMADKIYLEWTVTNEVNNDQFIILRKTKNDIDFVEIGRVAGGGNSVNSTTYTFNDYENPPGDVMYQIKQVDFDGAYSFSEIVQIHPAQTNKLIEVYPVPTRDVVQIDVQSYAAELNFVLRSEMGEALVKGNWNENTKLSLSEINPGVYFLEVYNDYRSEIHRLVKL